MSLQILPPLRKLKWRWAMMKTRSHLQANAQTAKHIALCLTTWKFRELVSRIKTRRGQLAKARSAQRHHQKPCRFEFADSLQKSSTRIIGNSLLMIHLSFEYRFSTAPTSNRLEHPLISLLESVNETGSIGKAAKQLNLSYRHVWGQLKHWETELNTNLIVWGKTSKGATLTTEAIQFLSEITQTQLDLQEQVTQIKYRVQKCVSVLKNSRTALSTPHSLTI